MKIVSLRLVVAALLASIGLIGLVIGLDYDFGTTLRMGPGYFPVVLSGALVLLALAEGASAVLRPDPQDGETTDGDPLDWRALVAILAAVSAFAVSISLFGLIPAFVVVIGLSALSEHGYGWKPALILSVVSCTGAWLLFSELLGMTLPLLRWGI